MKKFDLLVMVDNTGIAEFVLPQLAQMAERVIYYEDFPTEEDVILQRIKDADAVLVSWNTALSKTFCRSVRTLSMLDCAAPILMMIPAMWTLLTAERMELW